MRRKVDWVQIALLAGALLVLVWSTQVGLYPSRYYIPFVSLLAVAFARLISELQPSVHWASIVAIMGAIQRRSSVLRTRFGRCIVALVVGALATVAWDPWSVLLPSEHYRLGVGLTAFGVGLLLIPSTTLLKPALAVSVAGLMVLAAAPGRSEVDGWTASERAAGRLVDVVARVNASGCPVVITGIDVERAGPALPAPVRLRNVPHSSCATEEAFVVSGPFHSKPAPRRFCAGDNEEDLGAWILTGEVVRVTRCSEVLPAAKSFVTRNRMN